MLNKPMTQAELQHIEHCNKILQEHAETVKVVINETEALLNNYVPILSTYVESIAKIRNMFGEEVSNIIKSTRQLGIVTSNVQEVQHFIHAVTKLNELLTPELVVKLQKISGEKD